MCWSCSIRVAKSCPAAALMDYFVWKKHIKVSVGGKTGKGGCYSWIGHVIWTSPELSTDVDVTALCGWIRCGGGSQLDHIIYGLEGWNSAVMPIFDVSASSSSRCNHACSEILWCRQSFDTAMEVAMSAQWSRHGKRTCKYACLSSFHTF